MSEYTPTTGDIRAEYVCKLVADGEPVNGDSVTIGEASAIFDRWLAEHDAKLIEKLANEWTRGAWANVPRKADRAADRLAAANYVGEWLRARAAGIREGEK